MNRDNMIQASFVQADFTEETWTAYIKAQKELELIKSTMLREAMKTPKGEYMQSTGCNPFGTMSWNQANSTVHFSTTGITISHVPVVKIVPNPKTQNHYLDHSTINALLHGKLLTDDEKRRLIEKYLPDGVLFESQVQEAKSKRDDAGDDDEIPF